MLISRRTFFPLMTSAALLPAGVLSARAANDGIGAVADLIPTVWGTPPGGERGRMVEAHRVYFEERIETEAHGAVTIAFTDGSSLTMGENSTLIIDAFIYNPDTGGGLSTMTLLEGAFRFLSGAVPKENVRIQTPTMTAGIRGTELLFSVARNGATQMSVIEGAAECRSILTGKVLSVEANQSAHVGVDGKWIDGGLQERVLPVGDVAVGEGLEAARALWGEN